MGNSFKSIKELLGGEFQQPQSSQYSRRSIKQDGNVFDFIKLIEDWPKIVGPKLAEKTIPLKIQKKNLVILTGHSAFSEQLHFMSNIIIEKVNEHFPFLSGKLNNIKFMTNPAFFNQQMDIHKEQQESAVKDISEITHKYSPVDQALLKEADHLLGEIQDEDVKKSLTSIFIQLHKSK